MAKEVLTIEIRRYENGGYFAHILRESGEEMKMEYFETKWGAKFFSKRWARKWAKGKFHPTQSFDMTVDRRW